MTEKEQVGLPVMMGKEQVELPTWPSFWVVVGNINGTSKAVVCEERALTWVREGMEAEGYENVTAIPALCHWTAVIDHSVHPHDVDGTGIRW